ncbi:MAG: LPS-assembly protein LptD, partial [Oceanobacter sp.]
QQQTLSGTDAVNAKRLVLDNQLGYRLENSWSYLDVRAGLKARNYQLFGASEADVGHSLNLQQSLPLASLDMGMVLERPLSITDQLLTQTLEPRITHIRSAYRTGQNDIPLFDTSYLTATYSSLFDENRFIGYDRLADQNKTSVGLTTRFLQQDGEQNLSASIGKAYYQNDRKVTLEASESGYFQLDSAAADSSLMTEIHWQLQKSLDLSHMMEWDHQDDFSRQQRLNLRFHPEGYTKHRLRLMNLGVNRLQYLQSDESSPQTYRHQLDTGLFWSIDDRWAISGRLLRDLKDYDEDERRPVNPVLEALAGVEYQNCCWRFQLSYHEYSKTNDDDPIFSTNKYYRFMFTIQFKGLATLGGSTDELLNTSIPGYSRRTYHDY